METKDCELILVSYKPDQLKADVYVEYMCYSINRTTDRALGKIKNVAGKDSFVLGNQQYYTASELKPVLPYVVSDEDIKLGDSYIDLEDVFDYYGEILVAGKDVDLHVINSLKPNFRKIIAFPSQVGYSKDMRHDENSCHLCVPVESYELNEIMERKGKCKIQMKEGNVKLVNNKVTFILN